MSEHADKIAESAKVFLESMDVDLKEGLEKKLSLAFANSIVALTTVRMLGLVAISIGMVADAIEKRSGP